MLAVDRGQVRAFRLAAQHLTRRLPQGALVEAAAACGFQNTPPGTAALALHARVERFSVEDLERALVVDKTLLQAWSLRGAPHIIPTRDQPVFLRGIAPRDESSLRAFIFGVEQALDKVGITATEVVAHASVALEDVLGERRMTKDELGVATAEWIRPRLTSGQQRHWKARSWYAAGQSLGESIVRFVLPVLALQGLCCHAERRGEKAYLARTPSWLGLTALDSHAAPDGGELVRRYLRCFGPSKVEHFAEWAGVAGSQAEEQWRLLAGDLIEVHVEGRGTWLHRDDAPTLLSPPQPKGLCFLPPHDPYLALRDRATIVAERTWQRELWRTSGNPGVVVADGEVVAAWRPKASRTRLDVTIEWLVPGNRRLMKRLDVEAQSLAAVRGFKSAKVITR